MKARAVKAAPAGAIPITTALNISALAREHGVSRKTIARRLAKGWRPPAMPTPRTPAQVDPAPPVRILKGRDLGKSTAMPVFARPSPAVTPRHAQLRPPLGVVRGVLLLLAVAFYGLIACAAVGGRG